MQWKAMTAGMILITATVGAGLAMASDINVHCSVSQGWIKTSEYDYLVPDSKNGSFEFNEMMMNFNSQVSDHLRVGVQFLGRDFGADGNNQMVVDWAVGDYQFNDKLGMRFGKLKVPYGFYNKTRDVDFLRTSVIMPQSVYAEMFRETLGGLQGISAYGSFETSSYSTLDYEVYAGAVDLDRTRFGITALDGYATQVAGNKVHTLSESGRMDAMYGGSLIWNTPIEGLRVGGTVLALEANYEAVYQDLGGVLPLNLMAKANLDVDYVTTGSIEYTRDRLTLAGEYMQSTLSLAPEFAGIPVGVDPDGNIIQTPAGAYMELPTYFQYRQSWYASASYRVSDLLELGTYYSDYSINWHDRDDDNPRTYQKDICLTARFDVTPGWTLKAEGHFINGIADLGRDAQADLMTTPNDEIEDSWNMFTVKTTYSF